MQAREPFDSLINFLFFIGKQNSHSTFNISKLKHIQFITKFKEEKKINNLKRYGILNPTDSGFL